MIVTLLDQQVFLSNLASVFSIFREKTKARVHNAAEPEIHIDKEIVMRLKPL